MLRFLSRRKVRNNIANHEGGHTKSSNVVGKNKIDCRIILLDGGDLSIVMSVSIVLQDNLYF